MIKLIRREERKEEGMGEAREVPPIFHDAPLSDRRSCNILLIKVIR